MQKNEIYLIQGIKFKEMTKEILEKANLAERIPSKDCRISTAESYAFDAAVSGTAAVAEKPVTRDRRQVPARNEICL